MQNSLQSRFLYKEIFLCSNKLSNFLFIVTFDALKVTPKPFDIEDFTGKISSVHSIHFFDEKVIISTKIKRVEIFLEV